MGSTTSALAIASIWRWPPEACRRAAAAIREIGEHSVERVDASGPLSLRKEVGREPQIVANRERREDVLGLRHESEAVPDPFVRRHMGGIVVRREYCSGMDQHSPAIALT